MIVVIKNNEKLSMKRDLFLALFMKNKNLHKDLVIITFF